MSIRPLSAPLAEKARQELNEDPNRLQDDLQHLKDWIAKQPHLRARTDDQWLVAFLRGCKYSLEKTKDKLDLYYAIRSTAPELFEVKRSSLLFDEILDTGTFLWLPKTAGTDSPRVTLIRPGKYSPDKISIFEMVQTMTALERITFVDDDHTVVAGSVGILDFEGMSMSHFLQMTPASLKKMIVFSQDAAPLRMKATHFINPPPAFETIFTVLKSFLNDKNKSRIHVHSSYEDLYKHIPKEILPAEYGGSGGTVAEIIGLWKNKVREYSTFLEEEQQFGTDESKRPGKPKTAEDMFGAEGSFRKLEVD